MLWHDKTMCLNARLLLYYTVPANNTVRATSVKVVRTAYKKHHTSILLPPNSILINSKHTLYIDLSCFPKLKDISLNYTPHIFDCFKIEQTKRSFKGTTKKQRHRSTLTVSYQETLVHVPRRLRECPSSLKITTREVVGAM